MKMTIFKFMSFLVFATFSAFAHAGKDWIGSGGEIFRFAKNPWFVKNTEVVSYCIDFDASSMSVDEGFVEAAFLEALEYWKKEFGKSNFDGAGSIRLATQEFVKHERCVLPNNDNLFASATTDLVIKAGHGTLAKEELEFLINPRKYIGVTVRTTAYHREQMRAGGFIYISSDIGKNAYENKGHLITEAWSKENLLTYVFIHELGHVFGIPHSGYGIMSEVFMDELLHKRFHKEYLGETLQSFMHPPKESYVDLLNGSYDSAFLGVPIESNKLKVLQLNTDEYEVYALKRGDGSVLKRLGVFRLLQNSGAGLSQDPVTLVHLPDEQKVFSLSEQFLNSFLLGPPITKKSGTGAFFKDGSRKPHPVYIDLKPDSMTFVSIVNGQAKPVLVYSSNRLLKKIPGL